MKVKKTFRYAKAEIIHHLQDMLKEVQAEGN